MTDAHRVHDALPDLRIEQLLGEENDRGRLLRLGAVCYTAAKGERA